MAIMKLKKGQKRPKKGKNGPITLLKKTLRSILDRVNHRIGTRFKKIKDRTQKVSHDNCSQIFTNR